MKLGLFSLFRLCLLLPLLAGVMACGQKGMFSKGVQPVRMDRIPGPDRATRIASAKIAAAGGELRCDFGEECHSAVSLISVVTDQGLARCSGVLISEDEVLTNDHCIGMALSVVERLEQVEDIPCSGEIYAHFAAIDGKPAVRGTCASIRFRSRERGIESVDYAILKLKEKIQDRALLKRAERGLENGEQVEIFRIQMDGGENQHGGTQSLLSCRASHGTFLYPQLNHSNLPLMTFGDCGIRVGNSGAPVITRAGELAGLIQGYLTVRQNEEIDRELKPHLLEGSFGLVGVATQTHCLSRVSGKQLVPCRELEPFEVWPVKDYLSRMNPWNSSLLPALESPRVWRVSETGEGFEKKFWSVPACGDDPEFLSTRIQYRSGLNARLQAVWLRDEEQTRDDIRFVKTSVQPDGGTLYTSVEEALSIPACVPKPEISSSF